MENATQSAEDLRKQISETEEQMKRLKEELKVLEESKTQDDISDALGALIVKESDHEIEESENEKSKARWPLTPEEYKRYGRQMIVPRVGIQGQLQLKNAKVLVVGAGGLGCPALAYLAGAGVGTIGIVDGDTVEVSNLHRQILHSTATIGMKKVDSAIQYLTNLNPNPTYVAYPAHLTPSNSLSIMSSYNLVLDCTDNPATRYLISDTCILLSIPLISASALRTEGQLILLNSPPLPPSHPQGGPCYRCVFPKPPPPNAILTCGEGGILGPVVGIMGVLQAIEALKLITSPPIIEKVEEAPKKSQTTMLLFSLHTSPQFRQIRLAGRRSTCISCGTSPQITRSSLSNNAEAFNYIQFCGLGNLAPQLSPDHRISAKEYAGLVKSGGKKRVLIDTREPLQFEICHLEGSVNIPITVFQNGIGSSVEEGGLGGLRKDGEEDVYVVCRRGNDSQIVVRKLLEEGFGEGGRWVGDIKGGLEAWRRDVNGDWPEY